MENKTYQFKKLTKEVLESLEDNRMYVLMGTNGHACSFSKGHIKHWINSYESVLLPASPLSKVGEVTEEQILKAVYDLRDAKYYSEAYADPEKAFWFRAEHIVRSLLQPQPVNSEGKKTENLGKYVFTFLKQNYHFPVQRAKENEVVENKTIDEYYSEARKYYPKKGKIQL